MATVNYPFSGLFKSRPFAHVGPQADRHREELLRWWRAESPPPPQQFLSASAGGARKDNGARLLNSPDPFFAEVMRAEYTSSEYNSHLASSRGTMKKDAEGE